MSKKFLLLAAASILAVTPATARNGQPTFAPWGVDLTAMDASVKPGDNFFQYVNGAWSKRTEIAPDRTFVGIDSVLNDQIEKDVRSIVEDMAKDPSANGHLGQQIGDLYASWMDEDAVERLGSEPLKPYLARVEAAKTRADLVDLFTEPGFDSPIGIGIYPDLKNPTRYAVYSGQSGLGMPNRDYYLLKGEKYDAYRKAYRDYLVKLQALAGISDPEARADRIIALETQIAKIHWTPEQQRDAEKTYNPMTRAQLRAFAPQFAWDRALAKLGLGKVDKVVLGEKTAIQAEARLFATVPLQTWKDWTAVHFISDNAEYLPKAFDDANFDFYSKTLRDVPTKRARWKRGVDLVNGALGEGVLRSRAENSKRRTRFRWAALAVATGAN